MAYDRSLHHASSGMRGFVARVLRSGKALYDRAAGTVDAVGFYARHAFGSRALRVVGMVAAVTVPVALLAGGIAHGQAVDIALTGIADTVALLIANILQIIVSFLGWLLVTVVGVLIWVAQYNGFITSPAVVNGWLIVRDLVNMFFVISLLLMAFGIMLNVGKYAAADPGKEIVKLAVAAILVNFSRTICGLLIDLSQVIMMTFVYGFKEAAGKNFLDAFRITAMLQNLNATPGAGTSGGGSLAFKVTISMILALVMTTIALGVVCVMTVMLAVRIVHLWVLVAISPIAFMPDTVSKIGGIKADWWKNFTEALTFGPLMAFFLWLSLVSVASGQLATAGFTPVTTSEEASAVANDTANTNIGLTEAFEDKEIQAFVIAICLLVMGTAKAKSMAGAIGTQGQAIYEGMKKRGKSALKSAATGNRLGAAVSEQALKLGTRIPLVKTTAAEQLLELRGARKKQLEGYGKFMKDLNPEERSTFAGGILGSGRVLTEGQKERQKAALLAAMEEAKKKPMKTKEDKAAFFAQKKQLLDKYGKLGKDGKMEDKKVDDVLKDLEKARPDLVIDPMLKKTDPQYAAQLKTFRDRTKNLSVNQLKDMADNGFLDSELAESVLMNASPKAISTLQSQYSHSKLDKFGATEDEIKRAQDAMRRDPKRFEYLDDEKRATAIRTMSETDAKAVDPALVTGKVLDAAIEGGHAKIFAAQIAQELGKEEDARVGNAALFKEVEEALKDDKNKAAFDALPPTIKAQIKEAWKGKSPEAVLRDPGNTMSDAFNGYDAASGNFKTKEDREAYQQWLQAGGASKRAAMVPESALRANGGLNNVTFSTLSALDKPGVRSMIRSGNADQVIALLDAADAIDAQEEDGVLATLGAGADGIPREQVANVVAKSKEFKKSVKQLKALGDNAFSEKMKEREAARKAAAKERRGIEKVLGPQTTPEITRNETPGPAPDEPFEITRNQG